MYKTSEVPAELLGLTEVDFSTFDALAFGAAAGLPDATFEGVGGF